MLVSTDDLADNTVLQNLSVSFLYQRWCRLNEFSATLKIKVMLHNTQSYQRD